MAVRAAAALVAAGLLVTLAAAPALSARKHRLKLPPKPALPRVLSIDETEYALTASRRVVSSGRVTINVYNRGMDDHDFVVEDSTGRSLGQSILLPGASDQLVITLPAGEYKLVCSLFRGTAISHEALGMVTSLRVQNPPGVTTLARRR